MRFIPFPQSQHEPSKPSRRSWYLCTPGQIIVRDEGGSISLPTDEDMSALEVAPAQVLSLGVLGDTEQLFAPFDASPRAPLVRRSVRSLYGVLDEQRLAIAGRALHTLDWLQTSHFCGHCGTATELHARERCASCPACGLRIYPRIAPSIIVLVHRGDEILLAHGARFPNAFYSTLAGFAEIGETLEETLLREVREEVGVTVGNIRYFGSQPWPFPHSLMVAFTAEWVEGDIHVDGDEIIDAKWFTADTLPALPAKLSIARQMIDAWVTGKLRT